VLTRCAAEHYRVVVQRYIELTNSLDPLAPRALNSHPARIPVCFRNLNLTQATPTQVQRYIPNPLLVRQRKFDIRVWALVTSTNPLVWYTPR